MRTRSVDHCVRGIANGWYQDTDNQLLQLREWCASAGHEIVDEYVDRISGAKGKDKRPEFARMFDDAHKRRFDIVLCWALDRFSREGMVPTIGHLQRLAAAGVGFHSFTVRWTPIVRQPEPVVKV